MRAIPLTSRSVHDVQVLVKWSTRDLLEVVAISAISEACGKRIKYLALVQSLPAACLVFNRDRRRLTLVLNTWKPKIIKSFYHLMEKNFMPPRPDLENLKNVFLLFVSAAVVVASFKRFVVYEDLMKLKQRKSTTFLLAVERHFTFSCNWNTVFNRLKSSKKKLASSCSLVT